MTFAYRFFISIASAASVFCTFKHNNDLIKKKKKKNKGQRDRTLKTTGNHRHFSPPTSLPPRWLLSRSRHYLTFPPLQRPVGLPPLGFLFSFAVDTLSWSVVLPLTLHAFCISLSVCTVGKLLISHTVSVTVSDSRSP